MEQSGTINQHQNQPYYPYPNNPHDTCYDTDMTHEHTQTHEMESHPTNHYTSDEYSPNLYVSGYEKHNTDQEYYYSETPNNTQYQSAYGTESYDASYYNEPGSTTPLRDESASNIRQDADIDYRPELYQTHQASYANFPNYAYAEQPSMGYVTCKNVNVVVRSDDCTQYYQEQNWYYCVPAENGF